MTSELKSKRLRDLTLQEEVDLENILMGEDLHTETIEDSIDSEREENAENAAELEVVSDEDDEF